MQIGFVVRRSLRSSGDDARRGSAQAASQVVQLVFESGGHRREYDIQLNNPSATIADLARALDPVDGDRRPLLIGDHQPDQDLPLREAGVYEGAVLRLGDGDPRRNGRRAGGLPARMPRPGPDSEQELVVVNGLDAGRRVPLWPGSIVVGRDPGCDVVLPHRSISMRHAELEVAADGRVTVTDLGSHNGTWIGTDPVVDPMPLDDGTKLRLGALELEARPVDVSDRPFAIDPARQANPAGSVPFNRPPRSAQPPPHDEIHLPKPPQEHHAKQPFSVIQVLMPLMFAGGMYLMLRSPMFLMFGLLSPMMVIGNFFAGRRRGKKQAKQDKERYRREMVELRQALDLVRAEERARRVARCPDPAEVLRRAQVPSTTLWERRPSDPDFLQLRVGLGDTFWDPPLAGRSAVRNPPEELAEALEQARRLDAAPVLAELSEGGVVGIVGDRRSALALARSLVCQAAVHHGPADLPLIVLTTPEAGREWDWVKWLPHSRDATGSSRRLSADPDLSTQMVEGHLKAAKGDGERTPGRDRPAGPALLAVVDDESLTQGRRAPTRNLLRGEAGPVAGIVIAEVADRLPAMVTTVVEMKGKSGLADVLRPQHGDRADGVMACGMSEDVARELARCLARFEDPEVQVVGAGLPAMVRLLPLLELEECTPEGILARWRSAGVDPSPAGPVGVTEDDVFRVDFVTDGPHGLVGGTTGAGKSELLRSLVAGMAASVDPDHLTFVLVDFKGGSAFDVCAQLPHTVGMVTDLDEHLAERALRCLEAELRHREKVLREVKASDLTEYLRSGRGRDPLPRLVVIIDEFATLKAELPDFVDALVGVAQRGRSLGVHMLLATQRPQGAISENIKANTNLRIALRTQDSSDSNDIIGTNDAADISRTQPGRAYVRLGPNEVVPIQSALSTGARGGEMLAPVELAPFVYGPRPSLPRSLPRPPVSGDSEHGDPSAADLPRPAGEDDGGKEEMAGEDDGRKEETDLSVLVDTINHAFQQTGRPLPRKPWPEELPAELDLDQLIDRAIAGSEWRQPPEFVPLALADDPDAQSQYPVGWRIGDGNLVIYGLVGSGTTTVLSSLALALARLHSPEDLHLYVMDFGAGELAALADLPHCGGVALASERERQQRVIRILRRELDRRRELAGPDRADLPTIVALVDGWSTFHSDFNDFTGMELMEAFIRVMADGPEVGINVVATADRAGAISGKVTATIRQRWALRLADPADFNSAVGVRTRAVPNMVPGHMLMAETEQLAHVARPGTGLQAAVEERCSRWDLPIPGRRPEPVRSLPLQVVWRDLDAAPALRDRPWTLPVGLAEEDLRPASLVVHEGEHLLVAGPVRSGRSTTLQLINQVARSVHPDTYTVAVATRRSPLSRDPRVDKLVDPDDLDKLTGVSEQEAPAVLLLFDDADAYSNSALEAVGTKRQSNLLVVAAVRSDMVRSSYQHWTRPLRKAQAGILLRPNPDLDGELLGTRLPRRTAVAMAPGRGYVISNGEMHLAQITLPDSLDNDS